MLVKHLKFGTYTDRGPTTCAGRPAAKGYEELDAKTYASWGVDYLKKIHVIPTDHESALKYGKMRDALNAGRKIFFLMWMEHWYAQGYELEIVGGLDQMIQIGTVLTNIDINAGLYKYASHVDSMIHVYY